MKTKSFMIIGIASALLVLVGALSQAGAEQPVTTMTKEALQQILSESDTYVLDVRSGRDWSSSEFKIQGAHRADPGDFDSWAARFPKVGTLVLYCA